MLLARFVAIVTGGELSSGRYSFGWYAARVEELVAAVVVLAVFLVKINELMLRLAARSRSTAEALAVGEARYVSLANVVPQLIWTTNANGDVEYVNDRWVAYTGHDLNRSRDGGWRVALHPDHELQIRDRWRHSLEQRRAVRRGIPVARRCDGPLPVVLGQRGAGARRAKARSSRGSAPAPTSTRRSGSRSARRSSRAPASGSVPRSTSPRPSRR